MKDIREFRRRSDHFSKPVLLTVDLLKTTSHSSKLSFDDLQRDFSDFKRKIESRSTC